MIANRWIMGISVAAVPKSRHIKHPMGTIAMQEETLEKYRREPMTDK